MKYGLVLKPIEEDHWVLGGVGRPVINPTGQWQPPKPEYQLKNGIETYNCTGFGTNQAFEVLAKFKGYDEWPQDASDRYLGIEAGTYPPGNDPHTVVQTLRNTAGAIPELALPFGEDIKTVQDYYSPKPTGLTVFGSRLLKKFKIEHEWVTPVSPDKLKTALTTGTVCVSVYAWQKGPIDDLYIKPKGAKDNHWVLLLGYKDGEYWEVFDHYDQFIKRLDWNFGFQMAKVYFMDKIPFTIQKTWWDRLWDLFKSNGLLGRIWSS